jgi:hypothetical protein
VDLENAHTKSKRKTFPPIIRYGILGVGLLIAIGGVIMLVVAYSSSKQAESSKSWPSAAARLLECEVRGQSTTNDGRTSVSYRVEVRYQYEVGAQLITGDQIYAGGTVGYEHKADAVGLQNELRQASPLRVYYSPEDPKESLLKPGDTSAILPLWIIGFSFIGFSILWAAAGWLITS